jgi:hypothetical protein
MSARQVLSIAAAIVVGCLIGESLLGQRTAAQTQVLGTEPQPVGRYQLSSAGAGAGTPYVIDTATGQVWLRAFDGTKSFWDELGSPIDKPKAKPTDKPKAKPTDKPKAKPTDKPKAQN